MQSFMCQRFGGFLSGFLCVMILSLIGPGLNFAKEPNQSEKAAISQEAQDVKGEPEWKILATSPGVKVISEIVSNPGQVLPSGENPLDAAQNWLVDHGFEEGRNEYKGKLLYISVGSAAVNATPSDPAFIDSRYLAFQRADLEAKAKTAIFMGVDLTTSRGSSERTINPKERSELETMVKASPTLEKNINSLGIRDTVYNLFHKASRLAEAKLDKALEESGVDVAGEKEELKHKKQVSTAKSDRLKNLRQISSASLKAAASAFADVQGTQTIQAFEGSYHNNYQVVVVTLWSSNLQRLVDSMSRGKTTGILPPKRAKDEIAKQLPTTPNELACLTGVRAYINQNGEHVLLAFGQAGVQVIGGREDKAYELAGKKARLRAMASIRSFMGEKVAFSASEKLAEALGLFVDEYQGGDGTQEYKSISQFREDIEAVARKQKITGLHGLLTKELTHAFTDKPLVLKVMAWSPSSQAMAQEVKKAIEHTPESAQTVKPVEKKESTGPARKGITSSGKGADKDAW